ncbi:uncharacterized protein TM35_000351270 [Trypanosoma theileri]|uniref:rRNA biogenesis protein RRP36 n=1 Tax=Trypanosoma theileri TaxID=67003 RepID=A0A1X0NLQ0_9TRYP|nr:uncharacterized protein TM35_000351270 [Trypanosoma theileri]ORC85383.1 hypothetical protein TM35_000351270 [Trypanosoma theileri]
MAGDNSDAPPPERSARVRPKRRNDIPAVRRRAAIDPRFSDLYGTADEQQFEQHYKFLREQQEEEQRRRRHRIRCLKCLIRRGELEESGADLAEYDLSENEREVFGEDHLDELADMRLQPLATLQAELQQLQRESQLHVSREKGRQARSAAVAVKREVVTREAAAVRAGVKRRAFVPRRSELRRAVLADKFERLEQRGGKAAVDKYVERKSRRHP